MKTKLNDILIIIAAVFMFCGVISSPLFSSANVSLSGSYLDTGKEGSLYGGGVVFSREMATRYIPDNLYIILSAMVLSGTENGGEMNEIVRAYVPVGAGVEYLYPLYNIPLNLKISGGGGVGYFRKDEPARFGAFIDYSKTMTHSATAPFIFMNAGVSYIVSQRVSVFADAGYHYSLMQEEWMSDPLAGIQINAGVTIAVTGMNRELE